MAGASFRSNVASVLVVGTGAAGLRAAIAAHEAGSEVVVVGKRRRDDAHTVLAAGGINAARTVKAFSTRMHEQVDLDSLTAELLAVADQTMEPTQVSLWLRPAAYGPSGTPRSEARPTSWAY